jgi:SPP1 family predicted phage head-tail adaptor
VALSTLELSQLRADANDYLPDTCTLQTLTRTPDGYGGWTETWANTHTGVACRVAGVPLNHPEGIDAAQVSSLTRWLLAVPYNQALNAEMRCVHDGATYEIEAVEGEHSHRITKHAYMRRAD